MVGPCIGIFCLINFCNRSLFLLLVKIMINKAVVGSGHRDAPKYAGEGVTLHGTPSILGVLWPGFSFYDHF